MSHPDCRCPFCDSDEVELVSAWGGQLITSQFRCGHCNTHFEAVRRDFAASAGEEGPLGWAYDAGRPNPVERTGK
ncbi:MAG: hypothetical protein JO372_18640 [Solirubrobacterales bacterium]|nr:hypothetical protein [Solirubrobacterales bacterium]